MARRDYGKIAQNIAILGAHATGIGVPIEPGVALYQAWRGERATAEDKAFVGRFVDQLDSWLRAPERRRRVDELGLDAQWPARLEARLTEAPAVGRPAAIALLRQELFIPLIDTPLLRDHSEALLGELVDALPELIVAAGDPYGALAALRATVGADIARLERLLADLDPAMRRAGDRALIAAYLTRLADRLNIDPWSLRYGAADPARLDAIQQLLRVANSQQQADDQQQKAAAPVDDLVERCHRLVILGGPGSGKSWSARRAVIRAAHAALDTLEALDPDDGLDQVELPLLATCAEVLEPSDQQRWDRLLNASLRRAATNLDQASRLRDILGGHQRFLIVLDGLDEAARVETDAIGELIDTHPGTVRVVITSRPGSWDPALLPLPNRDRHRKGTLEPFTTRDRDAAVAAWLDDLPDTRDRLLALLKPDTALGRQATVPLICALYCLVVRPDSDHSGEDRFALFEPGRRLALYDAAIRRLLSARWRGQLAVPSGSQVTRALAWLEQLAQDGDITDKRTGLGHWPDAVTPTDDPDPDIAAYIDHIAPPDPYRDDRDRTRRFIHRSLREHLFAKTLSARPAPEAAELILPHLWSDPDWAEVIPTVIAAHPDPDQLLDCLTCHRVVINDPTHSLENHLINAAARCTPQPTAAPQRDARIAAAIRATDERTSPLWLRRLAGLGHWPATRPLVHRLVGDLATSDLTWHAAQGPAERLAALDPGGPHAQAAAERLVDLITGPNLNPNDAWWLAKALAALDPGGPHAQAAAERLVDLITGPNLNPYAAARLAGAIAVLDPGGPHAQAAAERLVDVVGHVTTSVHHLFTVLAAAQLAKALAVLDPGGPHAQAAAERLVDLITADPDPDAPRTAGYVAQALAALDPGGPHAQAAAERILDRLTAPNLAPDAAEALGEALVELTSASSRPQALAERIVDLITPKIAPDVAGQLAEALAVLDPGGPRAQAGAELIARILAAPNLSRDDVGQMAQALAALDPGGPHTQAAAERLVDHLTTDPDPYAAARLAQALAALDPDGPHTQAAAERLVDHLTTVLDPYAAGQLAAALAALDPDGPHAEVGAELTRRELDAPSWILTPDAAELLAPALAALDPGGPHTQAAAEQIVDHLTSPQLDPNDASQLAQALAALTSTSSRPQALAERIVDGLATVLDPDTARDLAELLSGLRRRMGFEEWVTVLQHSEQVPLAQSRIQESRIQESRIQESRIQESRIHRPEGEV